MLHDPQFQAEYEATIRSWERTVPWYRRLSARTGLQGKLVLSFMFLLIVTLFSSAYQFVRESREMTTRLMDGKSTTLGHVLALTAEAPLAARDAAELNRLGRDVLKSRDIVGVAFFDASGAPLAAAWKDPQLARRGAVPTIADPRDVRQALRIRRCTSPELGAYLEVTAPVAPPRSPQGGAAGDLSPEDWEAEPAGIDSATRTAPPAGPRLLPGREPSGYVAVCVSEGKQNLHVSQARAVTVLIGAVAALVSLPMVYLLVYRIFHPIRTLVAATNRIAAGELDAEVAIYRPDVIGTLARSFNEMVKKVRRQQQDLASANQMLARANEQLAQANEQLARTNQQLEGANAQLNQSNKDLEQKVRQRTAQLEAANQRLSKEIAEKEDFLRAVSHDLNAPLRNIAGMATMLLMKHRERFDEDIVHRLERIQKNVQVETDLIAELLELSRIKTRRQQMEPVDLSQVVSELAEVFEQDLSSRQIELIVETHLPELLCERARVRQVFQNLIDNAIKYMGEGQPASDGAGHPPVRQIRIGCAVRADEAEFYVRDTGIGIEPDDLDKVFFVFRRGRSAAAQNVAGKGVGLASVKSIVETYSGTIWVESQVGRGSTFRFTINGKHVLTRAPEGRAPPPSERQPVMN